MAASTLQFRIATAEDAPQIQDLVQSAFRAEDIRPDWVGLADLAAKFYIDLDEVLVKINQPNSLFMVATSSAASVGDGADGAKADGNAADGNDVVMVAAFQLYKRSAELARFAMFAVDHRYHRRGFGRRSLTFAEDYCRRIWGVSRVDLDALSTRPALIAWYERCGYRRTGETMPFPMERIVGLTVPEDLHFITLDKHLEPIEGAGEVA